MYRDLYYKQYEPFGYRWATKQLPDWIHLTVEPKGRGKMLVVHSKIHVNKRVEMNPPYSSDFTDQEIIKDLSAKISSMFL